MDRPRDCHLSEVSKKEKDKWYETVSYRLYVESENGYKWINLQNRNIFTDIENKCLVTKGERVGKDKLGVWNQHLHTTIYKTDK